MDICSRCGTVPRYVTHVCPPPSLPQQVIEPREGMLTVYDWNGGYRGCIGVETWERLLREARVVR